MMDYSLYLVTDPDMVPAARWLDTVLAAVEGGVTVVQLRDKRASGKQLYEQALVLKQALDRCRVPLLVNDRIDVALAVGAAGAHLGQEDMPCAAARRLVGPSFVLGVSVSTVEQARRAAVAGADYLGVSPVFDTPTKPDTPEATGLAGLSRIRACTALPLVGIGGLHEGNAAAVRRAGADGLAVVSALMAAPDPRAAAQRLRAAIDR